MHQQQIQKVKAGFLTTQKKSGQAWGGGRQTKRGTEAAAVKVSEHRPLLAA